MEQTYKRYKRLIKQTESILTNASVQIKLGASVAEAVAKAYNALIKIYEIEKGE